MSNYNPILPLQLFENNIKTRLLQSCHAAEPTDAQFAIARSQYPQDFDTRGLLFFHLQIIKYGWMKFKKKNWEPMRLDWA